MSAPGRIPVLSVDPKIEERLRRKREKQRIYDRRRREASGLGSGTLPATISEDGGEADSGSEVASSSVTSKVSKKKTALNSRRHSTSSAHASRLGRSSPSSELSVHVRKASIGPVGSPNVLSGSPNVLAGNPLLSNSAEALPTPLSGNSQISHGKVFQQPSPTTVLLERDLSPNSKVSMYYSKHISPMSPLSHQIGIAGPLPSGNLASNEDAAAPRHRVASPDSALYHSSNSRSSTSPGSSAAVNTGATGASASASASSSANASPTVGNVGTNVGTNAGSAGNGGSNVGSNVGVSAGSGVGTGSGSSIQGGLLAANPAGNAAKSRTSPRSLSVPSLYSAAPANVPRNFLVPGHLSQRSRRFSVAHDTYADMLAADFGIDPVDVDDSKGVAVASDADTPDAQDWYDQPFENQLAPAGSGDSGHGHSMGSNLRLEAILGQTGHYIADPRLPEPVGFDLFGNESAYESVYESVYESFYESAFEDESPPEVRGTETLPFELRSPPP